MILQNPPRQQKAFYDADGNIIIPGHAEPAAELSVHTETDAFPGEIPWVEIPEENEREAPVRAQAIDARNRMRSLTRLTKSLVDEGVRQYSVSIDGAKPVLTSLTQEANGWWQVTTRFLAQPVWVPGRRNSVRQYSRGTLFLVDIVRFGGTFAAIFGALFVALNFQSYKQITLAHLHSILAGPQLAMGEEVLAGSAVEQKKNHAENGSYLPMVGPPEDRIVIPKLKLNIPLVTPSYESLLRQDWERVEEDIQAALQIGVVHYPGTARPGQAGNFFVTGHSSYYPWAPGNYKTVFARLHELEPGDEYFVYYGGDKHRYVVRTKKEVLPSDVSVLDQPSGKRYGTLMTCTPIGTTLRRLILAAEEVDLHTGIALKVGERGEPATTLAPKLEALPI